MKKLQALLYSVEFPNTTPSNAWEVIWISTLPTAFLLYMSHHAHYTRTLSFYRTLKTNIIALYVYCFIYK